MTQTFILFSSSITIFNLSTCGFVLVNDVTNANSNRGAKKLFFKITSLRTTQIFNHTSSIRTVREKILIGFRFSTSWPTVLRRIVQPHLRILIRCELRLECSPANVAAGICRYWYYHMTCSDQYSFILYRLETSYFFFKLRSIQL